MTLERDIQLAIIKYLSTLRWLRFWRQNTGVATFGNRRVRFGLVGQADISGILPDGRRLEIEVKSEKGKQTREQAWFQAVINKHGGLYILARSVEEVKNGLKEEYPERFKR